MSKLRGKSREKQSRGDKDAIKKREERAAKPAFPSFRKSKPKPKKAKPTFRSGNSQGRGVIKNMNRITETAMKRFK